MPNWYYQLEFQSMVAVQNFRSEGLKTEDVNDAVVSQVAKDLNIKLGKVCYLE